MGILDTSSLSLDPIVQKLRSWIPWNISNFSSGRRMCCDCKTGGYVDFSLVGGIDGCRCPGCSRVLCGNCIKEHNKFCGVDCGEYDKERISDALPQICSRPERIHGKDNVKLFQSHHLARFLEAQQHGSSVHDVSNSSVASSTCHPSPVCFRSSSSRSDEEEGDESGRQFFSLSSEYCRDVSDVDSNSVSARYEFYSFRSIGSSPLDSPSRMSSTPTRVDFSLHQEREESPLSHSDPALAEETISDLRRPETETDDLEHTDDGSDDLSIYREQFEKGQRPFDFENNGLIWFPPPPEVDEMENDFFNYDDEDDDVGESGMMFSTSSFDENTFADKQKANEGNKEPLQAMVHGHFRALVSQLLQGEGICVGKEDREEGWLDIVSSIAWQAANFVKPDTRKGGSMDPAHYVKVKCIVSGTPSESTFIKGVVCTKNIKHKRMTSQYKKPRLLLLGGALEYQRIPNQLASFDTLLQQEIDHLKRIVAKIEAYHPNVLLVEKSVSSYAQEYLLAKDISLVLNVKRPLLERIARCTGAHIVSSIDNLSTTRLGHCEVFRLEKVLEECVVPHQPNKKSAKTLMFFEGCPRRLGCTVLLKGANSEVLKKVKHVVQYAVFAAYHLSLETCFLADEGATLPEMLLTPQVSIPERQTNTDVAVAVVPNPAIPDGLPVSVRPQYVSSPDKTRCISPELQDESPHGYLNCGCVASISSSFLDSAVGRACSDVSNVDLVAPVSHRPFCNRWRNITVFPSQHELLDDKGRAFTNHRETEDPNEWATADRMHGNEVPREYFSTVDNHQSILVSFSSHCVLKGSVCERSQLLRIKFYGSFDKPLGRYLQDDLFSQTSYCRSCKEPTDAHVRCYTHQHGNLTINVRRLPSVELPGERDGKMWMWHRCLKCAHINGVPPATRRVIMSDAAWGLSFGKFLELSFSNHATANRIASCGHSLQRDCLRYYGFGAMVAFFRYSPIDILSVCLPPSLLDFNGQIQLEWVKRELMELSNKMEVLYAEVFDALYNIEQKGSSFGAKQSEESDFHTHVTDLKVLLKRERNEYEDLLLPAGIENSLYFGSTMDILELNRLRRCLLIDSYIWDHRLYSLDSLLKTNTISKVNPHILEAATYMKLKEWRDSSFFEDDKLGHASGEYKKSLAVPENPKNHLPSDRKEEPDSNELTTDQLVTQSVESYHLKEADSTSMYQYGCDESNPELEAPAPETFLESLPSPASNLSDKIDSAWTGTGQPPPKEQVFRISQPNDDQAGFSNQKDDPSSSRFRSPVRVHSFDSALRIQEKIRRRSASLQLSSLRSFHASGDYRSMVRDPIPDILRSLSQTMPRETQKLNFIFSSMPSLISSASHIAGEGFRFLLSQTSNKNMVIPVHDDEPTSIVAYVLGSNEYENWISNKHEEHEGVWIPNDSSREDEFNYLSGYHHSASSIFPASQSHSSLSLEDTIFRSHGSEDVSQTVGGLFLDPKRSHFRVSFGDESSSPAGKVKFSVICYFARQFYGLRQKCCPSEVDFIRSLSRCSRWNAQGGKSNVYFARSFDERFIIKQVTKTELDSFEEFAPEYFKYMTDSHTSGSPTCLAKVLGIYQVSVKHVRGSKESRMDLMVMENLFFGRSVAKIYDLKGSSRSRYNPDTTGKNKVLLDTNLLETLRTNPIFLSSKAKRSLERAVWNDTSFLASVDVMDYSLLVGVDEERKELVLGIIDFMRQYTWDKHLETWVKAAGILGGPKNASPTVISPKQYKKRFRKAMSTYFLTVPDQWSS